MCSTDPLVLRVGEYDVAVIVDERMPPGVALLVPNGYSTGGLEQWYRRMMRDLPSEPKACVVISDVG